MKIIHKLFTLSMLLTSVWAQYPAQWVVNAHDFEHTMTVTGELFINDLLQVETSSAVAAFHNGECRGVVEGTQVGDEVIYFLLIYGNTQGDSLEFLAWDNDVGNVLLLDEQITFSSGAAIGAVDTPYQLSGTNSLSYIEAFSETYEVPEDYAENLHMNILANDIYDRSLALLVTFPSEPLHGMLFENVDQTFSYVSDLNFFGQDSFQYRVSHAYGSDSAWVRIEVTPVDDPLTAFHLLSPGDYSLFEHGSNSMQTFSWELPIDYDGDPISYSLYIYDGETLDSTYSTSANSFTVNLEDHNRDTWLDWYVIAFDGWGWTISADTFAIQISSLLDIKSSAHLPKSFAAGQNFPNPFNPSTSIPFDIPEAASIALQLFDLSGKRISTQSYGIKPQGRHRIVFDLRESECVDLKSGIYLYRLSAQSMTGDKQLFNATRRMVILK